MAATRAAHRRLDAMTTTPSALASPLLVILVIILGYDDVHGQSKCLTPSGGRGQCIAVRSCDPIIKILTKRDKTQEDIQLVRNSQCGYQNDTPYVCCPTGADPSDRRCFTPDAAEGVCQSLLTCAPLTRMLQPPVSPENKLFLQLSKCEGPDRYNVCCGRDETRETPRPRGQCSSSTAPPDPRTECCGLDGSAGNKIFGGNVTAIDQYPWVTVIEYKSVKDGSTRLLCGGVLISGRYVLTAAHCVTGPVLTFGTPVNVRVGEYDTAHSGADCTEVEGGGMDCTEGALVAPIEDIVPHKEYDPRSVLRRHDIALIRLQMTVPYTSFIRPICLPTSDVSQLSSKQIFYAAGWGAVSEFQSNSNVKLQVDLPFVPRQECQTSYSVPQRNVALWDGQICAGGEKGKDSCKGDSGGPLMMDNGRLYEVVGIVSFGPTPCGIADVPGVYTKVYAYLPWIRTHVKP